MEELIEIKKVDSIELNNKLIDYVKNFSWNEVKEHVLMLLNNWYSDEHEEWEANFVALYNDKIIGKISVHKEDYYPLPEIYPWVSGIFVSEEYRGHRISEKLIDYANQYLKEYGFNQTYIPTHHIGLYEKYGYTYVKDIINYGGGTDRLYVKKIL